MKSKLKMYIDKPVIGGNVKVYLIDESSLSERRNLTYNSAEKNFTVTMMERGSAEKVEPFFEFPSDLFEDFVSEIVEFAKKENIKTDNESVLEGKLKATEKHLEDMRTYFEKALAKITK